MVLEKHSAFSLLHRGERIGYVGSWPAIFAAERGHPSECLSTRVFVSITNFSSQDKSHRRVIQPKKEEYQTAQCPIQRWTFLSERDVPRETPSREFEEQCPAH